MKVFNAEGKEINKKLNQLAVDCILGRERKKGKPFIKGPNKGKRRILYKLDPFKLKEILKILKPYIYKSVFNSTRSIDLDLISFIETEIWKLLREFGSNNFSTLSRLRVLNCVTTNANMNKLKKRTNLNIDAISYFTKLSNNEGENSLLLIDKLRDNESIQLDQIANYYLLDEKERKLFDKFLSLNNRIDEKRFAKKYSKVFLSIYEKIN